MRITESEITGRLDKNLNLTKKICQYCGKEFYSNYERSRFCSNSCRVQNWRRKHQYDDGEESSDELFNDNSNDNLNSNTMSSNELITQIQKNSDLNLQLKMLEKDYEILKRDFGQIKSENESLKSEIESLKSEIENLQQEIEELEESKDAAKEGEDLEIQGIKGALRDSEEEVRSLTESLEETQNQLARYELAITCYRCVVRGKTLTFQDVKKVRKDADINKNDRLTVDNYQFTRLAGEERYRMIKT